MLLTPSWTPANFEKQIGFGDYVSGLQRSAWCNPHLARWPLWHPVDVWLIQVPILGEKEDVQGVWVHRHGLAVVIFIGVVGAIVAWVGHLNMVTRWL